MCFSPFIPTLFCLLCSLCKNPTFTKSPKHSAAITDQNLTSCCWWDVSLPPKLTVGAEKQWSCNIHHQNALKLYNNWSTQCVKPWPISNTSWSHYQGGVKERRNISHHSFVIFSPNLIRSTYNQIKSSLKWTWTCRWTLLRWSSSSFGNVYAHLFCNAVRLEMFK